MYLLSGSCDYCEERCSRQKEDLDKGIPMLYTMNIYGMKKVCCARCEEKIHKKLNEQFTKWAKEEK